MKIIRELQPRDTIEAFAEKHGLTMSVVEYSWGFGASFEHAETLSGSILTSEYGMGAIEDDAIADYARKISKKRLVINATGGESRREIQVPILRYGALDLARIHEARGDKKKPMLTVEE